uniref:Signal peptidase complex subunit 1 n=1 Tax=Acrobeloides nanus TaxID=290746 RepID=A0A914BWW2_9BILA
MDGVIQSLPPWMRPFSTHIDFVGQQKAERIFQVILVVHGIIGFIAGFVTQQLSVSMYTIGFGFLLSCLIVLPPWPFFRRHPLNWQPNQTDETSTSQQAKPKENKKRR